MGSTPVVGAFSVIVQPVVEPMDRFAALIISKQRDIYFSFLIPEPPDTGLSTIHFNHGSGGGWQTGAGETGGLDINIPIIFTLYISTRLHRTYCFIQVGCHVTIHVPSSSSKLQHQRAATRDPVWPPIEIRIMACWRVEGAAPSPAQAIRS